MNPMNLKEIVRDAIKSEWAAFAQEHPRLAEVIDETLLVSHLSQSLANDPEFQDAMRDAQVLGNVSQAIDWVRHFVRNWLRVL